jgi:flavodoxin
MKKLFTMLFTTILIISLVACGASNNMQENYNENNSPTGDTGSNTVSEEMDTAKILVAFFSYSGNTRTVANQIQKQVGGDLFEIETTYQYPTDYNEVLDQAQEEKNSNARPELNNDVENMADYDIVFIGYSNWSYDMPMAVYSFLDVYDLSGKTVIPFSTHGSSGLSNTINSIKSAEPDAKVLDGFGIRDSNVDNANDDIDEWLKDIEMMD